MSCLSGLQAMDEMLESLVLNSTEGHMYIAELDRWAWARGEGWRRGRSGLWNGEVGEVRSRRRR